MVRAPGFSLGGSRFESVGRHFVTLAQLVERRTFNPVVVGSSPTCDKFFYLKFIISFFIMNDKSNDSIDISIRIGNSYDHTKILTGSTYTYKVKRNTFIKELKQMLSDEFNESETKNIINRYNIYNNRIILLNENNVILDAFTESTASDLDLIDNNETLFYALLI